MKITKIFYLPVIAITFLTSCELSNMASKYSSVKYTTTPPILQVHGGDVKINLDAQFPEKYFAKKVKVELTPVLVYENGETAFKTIILQGEEASGGEKTIFYEKGGSIAYEDEIKYTKEMMNSNLELRAVAKIKNQLNIQNNQDEKQQILGPIPLAKGVITTPNRVLNTEDFANDNHNYEHETILKESATVYFLVNQSNIRTTEKSKEDMKRLKEFASKKYKTHSIEIVSYASPEGSVNTNTNISDRRMQATVRYTKKLLQSFEVEGANNPELYTETSVGEDWEGFQEVLGSSNIKDKRKINKIVSSVEDVEIREQQIRDLSEIYDAIKDDVLPQLRKATIIIRSYEPKRTDEKIAELSTTYPDSLNLKELLFAATLTENNDAKRKIYNSVINLHNDWRGYNNLACTYMKENNIDEAKRLLKKAEEVSGKKSDILINEGILSAWSGSLKHAQALYNQGNVGEKNQAILNIRKGDYEKAARYFKNSKSHNGVLAQLMNGNTNMNCNDKSGPCHYLNAIIAARRGENELVLSNLSKAIAENPNYKKEASIDLEFINLRMNDSFNLLIK